MKTNSTLNKLFVIITSLALSAVLGCGGEVFKNLLEGGGGDKIPPRVISIMSTAYDKVRVEFSEEVDATTAADISSYDITDLDIFTAEMDSNPKVVRLTTDLQFFTTYDITVFSAVEDLKGNPMTADYTGTFEGAVNEPRLVSVTAIKVNELVLEFSESVDTAAAGKAASYTIAPSLGTFTDGDVVHPYSANAAQVWIQTPDEMLDTTYSLNVVGSIKDSENYTIHPLYDNVSFTGDSRPRIVQINSTSTTTFRIKFSEPVNKTTAETKSNYTLTEADGGATVYTISDSPGPVRSDTDTTIVDITMSPAQLQESYKVVINNITDSNGNAVKANTAGYFLGNGPPSVAKAVASGPTKVIVTFSEPLNSADDTAATTAANYTISGLAVSAAAWPGGLAGDRTVIELTTGSQLQQPYTLTVTTGVLHAADDNAAIASGYNTAGFQGDGLPRVSSAVSINPTHVKVVFSETITQTTAENVSNYAITSTGYPSLTITGAQRQSAPNTNEVILTTSTQLYVNYTVTVTGVLDTTNNVIAGNNTANFAGTGTDATPPNILSAGMISTTKIRIYFNEGVDSGTANTNTNYTVNTLSTASITVTGQPALDQTLKVSVPSSSTGTNSITITAKGSETLASGYFKRDASSNQLIAYSIANAINADSKSPVQAYCSSFFNISTWLYEYKVELVSRTFGTNGDITVDETLDNISASANPSVSAQPTTAARSAGNNAQVDITFGTALANQVYQLTIINVKDLATPANAIVSASTTVIPRGSDATAPRIKGVFAPDSTHIKLLFDEPVNDAVALKHTNYKIERETGAIRINANFSAGDTITITYDSTLTFIMTATNSTFDIVAKQFRKGTYQDIVDILNNNASSPCYAHYDSATNTIFIIRRTATGTLNNVSSSGNINWQRFSATFGTNNRTIVSAARSFSLPNEVVLTLDKNTALASATYSVVALNMVDISDSSNTAIGGSQMYIPISSELTAPPADTTGPVIVSAQSLSDGVVQVVFNETVTDTTAEVVTNYSISPTLIVTQAVRDDNYPNVVLLYTQLQAALRYTLTANGINDQSGNSATNATASFTGMAAVTPNNGPVGNAVSGIGNIKNKSITAMAVFNNILYVATLNSGSGEFLTEIYSSDSTGVYFTQNNNSGFNPPTSFYKQRQTTSFAIYLGDLWASTSDTPSERANVFHTDGTDLPIHDWLWDTTAATDWGNTTTRLLTYGMATSYLYVIAGSSLYYRFGADDYDLVSNSWGASTPTCMVSHGGRLYVGTTGMKVYRSKGANADAPRASSDFEQVLDSSSGLGMDGWLAGDASNTYVASIASFNGYIYIGTNNSNGAQVWRSQDGLTWERVANFDSSDINDANNIRVTSMQVNGNFLYIGTKNYNATLALITGLEVWRTPDGVTWNQYGSDGFGSANYTDVTSMTSFNGLIYFGVENTTSGGTIFRGSN